MVRIRKKEQTDKLIGVINSVMMAMREKESPLVTKNADHISVNSGGATVALYKEERGYKVHITTFSGREADFLVVDPSFDAFFLKEINA